MLHLLTPYMSSDSSVQCTEVSTHNLYFHEEASIFSVHSYKNRIVTCGGDYIVREWDISFNDTSTSYKYTTALNSSTKIKYIRDLTGHNKSVNCVRYSDTGLIASSGDGGRVLVHSDESYVVVREADNTDCYELLWIGNKLCVGLSNGSIEIYEVYNTTHKLIDKQVSHIDKQVSHIDKQVSHIDKQVSHIDNITHKLIDKQVSHNDIIQGMAYNNKYELLLTLSKDRTAKLHSMKNMETMEKYITFENEKLFRTGKSFFRRTCFSDDGMTLYLCNACVNSVMVVSYPFTLAHYTHVLGPFDTEPVKVLTADKLLCVLTKRSLYVFKEYVLSFSISNICFKSPTDATVIDDCIFISSLDGFITSVRYK